MDTRLFYISKKFYMTSSRSRFLKSKENMKTSQKRKDILKQHSVNWMYNAKIISLLHFFSIHLSSGNRYSIDKPGLDLKEYKVSCRIFIRKVTMSLSKSLLGSQFLDKAWHFIGFQYICWIYVTYLSLVHLLYHLPLRL